MKMSHLLHGSGGPGALGLLGALNEICDPQVCNLMPEALRAHSQTGRQWQQRTNNDSYGNGHLPDQEVGCWRTPACVVLSPTITQQLLVPFWSRLPQLDSCSLHTHIMKYTNGERNQLSRVVCCWGFHAPYIYIYIYMYEWYIYIYYLYIYRFIINYVLINFILIYTDNNQLWN